MAFLLKATFLTCVVLATTVDASPFFGLFSFPESRRGRATAPTVKAETPEVDPFTPPSHITLGSDADHDDKIIQALVNSVLNDGVDGVEDISVSVKSDPPLDDEEYEYGFGSQENSPITKIQVNNGRLNLSPRRVEEMSQFGAAVQEDSDFAIDNLPQLADRTSYREPASPVMRLGEAGNLFARQVDDGPTVEQNDDDDVRCIPKVMQIEETVYDRSIKCQHSYQEKCHMTYITDYKSTTQEKCETTFKKNCHITFKPMPFNETVNICHTPLKRVCGSEAVGPDICSTHYETNCETRYKTYEVEQDEPVCKMEIMKKCNDVTVDITPAPVFRSKRQTESQDPLVVDEECEQWPVQRCTLEKKSVKKVHPQTECNKIPREVCIPNNCQMEPGEEICRDESRMQIQQVPEEECELQPEETCHAEAVLVPKLVPTPNCVKVPKEICVNTKSNPRRVKKPIVKEWCYRPSDLAANPGLHIPVTTPEDNPTTAAPDTPTTEATEGPTPGTPSRRRSWFF